MPGRKYLPLMLILILVACQIRGGSAIPEQLPIKNRATEISVTTTQVSTPSPTIAPERTDTPVPFELTEPAHWPSLQPTLTPTDASLVSPPLQTQQKCINLHPANPDSGMAGGVVLNRPVDLKSHLEILSNNGLKPVYLFKDYGIPEGNSSDGKLFSFLAEPNTENILSFTVINPSTSKVYKKDFKNIKRSKYSSIYWVNSENLVIPLANQGETFEWLVWSPRTNTDRTLSAELTGIGQSADVLHIPPQLDPTFEFVFYRCGDCEGITYIAKSLSSVEKTWKVQLEGYRDTYRSLTIAPAWSPNGQFIAFVEQDSGFFPSNLWVFDHTGKLVLHHSFEETVLIGGLRWSPDSSYLAMIRNQGKTHTDKSLLLILDIQTNTILDPCIEINGNYVWSPDSSRLVISNQTEPGKVGRTLIIYDVNAWDGRTVSDEQGHILLGWVNFEK
jgi:WD40-like Beta Propeller Repeat